MKIWGNKVVAENNKVKRKNVLNLKYQTGVHGGVVDRLASIFDEKVQGTDEGGSNHIVFTENQIREISVLSAMAFFFSWILNVRAQ